MKKKNIAPLLATLLISTALSAQIVDGVLPPTMTSGGAVVPHDEAYYTHELDSTDVELIYTEGNIPFAKHVADIEEPLHEDYEEFYNWKLDETLHVGIISNCNQIANGFSTQLPKNRQINYIGGTQLVDHFTTTSWLDVLIYHETAHNYQLNVKGSSVSRGLHSVFGNSMGVIVPIPIIMPNFLESSFMLEGNAVLNESWHGSGGRIYSGALKAMTLLQAKADRIHDYNMYNINMEFPYFGDSVYHIGGFFNLYTAENSSIKEVNSYFRTKSEDWYLPVFTNSAFEKAVGTDFSTTMDNFTKKYAELAQNLVVADGEHIASSQAYYQMSSDKDEIFFITNETGVRAPELVTINKADATLEKDRDSWLSGKIVKSDGEYYTQAGRNTSVTKITQGLFDNDGYIKEGTEGKMIQGYLSDGRAVYFDVKTSFDFPQLYVGEEHYGYTNSSVFIDDNDNIYYFANKNKGKERTLYKNKTALYTYQGFYGIVSDVADDGSVYFVANSELGSTLYRYRDGEVTRSSDADNIFAAKLLNDKEVILCAVSEKDYYFVKNDIKTLDGKPFNTKFFFEDDDYFGQYETSAEAKEKHSHIDTSHDYYSVFAMDYSGLDVTIGTSSNSKLLYTVNANFSDPLTQNAADIFISRDESNVTIAGAGYSNSQYLLQYSVTGYGVVDNDDRNDTRDYGVIAGATLPFYKAGYYNAALGATYFQDYDTLEREPLTTTLGVSRNEMFANSMYLNSSYSLVVYGAKEREDSLFGAAAGFRHDLPYEFYFKVSAKYSATDDDMTQIVADADTRGVKISANVELMDISSINMPSVDNSMYAKSIGYGEVGLTKVINLSSYWFTFPFSLKREAIYTKFRYYEVESFDAGLQKDEVNEAMVGMRFDIVFLNKMVLPLSIDYYSNDNEDYTKDSDVVKFTMGSTF